MYRTFALAIAALAVVATGLPRLLPSPTRSQC